MVSSVQCVGIVGGGQLALMMIEAAEKLGLKTRCIDLEKDAPAATKNNYLAISDWDVGLRWLAEEADIITWEREALPLEEVIKTCEDIGISVQPTWSVLQKLQDRFDQKSLFDKLALATSPWAQVNSILDIDSAIEQVGLPAVVKARRGGFDGRGQMFVHSREDVYEAQKRFEQTGAIMEAFIDFEDECAALVTRDAQGNIVFYSSVLTRQEDGQLAWAMAPHPHAADFESAAQMMIRKIVEELNYVGTMAMECFRSKDGLIINELAPRVHNSGHWTIEGAQCGQFENHIRAVAGLPLASAELVAPVFMYNCLGSLPAAEDMAQTLGYLHDYHKAERPNRKVGHATFLCEDNQNVHDLVQGLPASLQPADLSLLLP